MLQRVSGAGLNSMLKFIFSMALLIVLCSGAFQAIGAENGERGGQPITIKSNELYTDSKSNSAVFTGKVVAKQQDVTIYADKLVVYYPEQGGEVDRVEAFGNVRIVQQNRLGTAGHAVYNNKEGKITLYIDPKVHQGKDVVSGKVITYFIGEEKSVVTGGPDTRVEAVIYPKGRGNDGERGSKPNP
jgi:lipopolysaccharide export system protein LptA